MLVISMKTGYALISVSDKTGVLEIAKALDEKAIKILSTGGSARYLKDGGLKVIDVSDHTGFPEMMDGRVKTLHPKIHGGLLCLRHDEDHLKQADENGVAMIDFVIANLYAFEETVANPEVKLTEAIEKIDIGGPSMLRSAAKNYRSVTVVTDPKDYPMIIEELKTAGETSIKTRERLALKVFEKTACYDAAIHTFLNKKLLGQQSIHFHYKRGKPLRYGENPHQPASIYQADDQKESVGKDNVCTGDLLHGKAMSYNNYLDAQASWETARDFRDKPACVIVKHNNPCGLATGSSLKEAAHMAWEGDIVSAFGSVISFTRELDLETAEFFGKKFVEIVIAPGYTKEALHFLKAKNKDLRILRIEVDGKDQNPLQWRHLRGGLLCQKIDAKVIEQMKPATKISPSAADENLNRFAFKVAKSIKSNAIAIAYAYKKGEYMLMGMGGGQPNRVDAIRKLAVPKAEENIARLYGKQRIKEIMGACVMASDGFFPFADNIEYAHQSGIKKIIQPGGSKKDAEVIETCNRYGISMVFTGMRHFLH